MISVLKKAIVIVLLSYLPFQSNAWGVLGHRIVGQIAESYLTPNAKKEVLKILGTESMAMGSTWADFIRSDSTMAYLSPWHYLNLNRGLSSNEVQSYLKSDTTTDAYTKINFLVKQLKNKQLSKDKKTFYLKLLIHFVGDIHQPLHVAEFEEGGNKIKVSWFNAPTNLHTVWDSKIIDFQQLSYTEYAEAINHITKLQRIELQRQPVSEWIRQSYQISEKIFGDVKPDDKLGYLYNFKYLDILNQQLMIGGIHLAGLLNEIFKN